MKSRNNFKYQVCSLWPEIGDDACFKLQSSGTTNRIVRIQCSQVFFLRQYRALSVEQIEREHELLIALAEKFKSIIVPILNCRGSSFSKIGTETYALFPAAKGVLLNKNKLSELHARNLGEFLAKLHLQLASVDGSAFPSINLCWDKDDWVKRFQKIITIIEADKVNDLDGSILRRVKQQQNYLASAESDHSFTPYTQRQLIHGDYHHFNVFFDTDGTVSDVIDWDLLQNMPPAYELARACMYIFDMEANKSLAFLKGYLSINKLSKYELNDGAKAWAIFSDHNVWALEEVFIKNNIEAKKFIPETNFIPFMDQWSKLADALKFDTI
tara:strand:- start:1120 stop:2100 length:981 start_codon:yes stop_codon:yes gene_type:complete